MSTGAGICIAGLVIAFVWACSISDNAAAAVVIIGVIIGLVRGIK